MSDDLTVSRLSTDDQLMIVRLREGDQKAVAAIHHRYRDELRLFGYRMIGDVGVAEDLVQEVLALCCQLRTDSLPSSSIRGWLYQIIRRKCIDWIRRQKLSAAAANGLKKTPQPSWDHAVDPLTTPAGKALKRDRAEKIYRILGEMDEDLRSVVVMKYFQELSREEIAESLGLTVAGTKSRLSKAMEVMREKLQRLDESLS